MKKTTYKWGVPALLMFMAAGLLALQYGCATKAADDTKLISDIRSTVETRMKADSLIGISLTAVKDGRVILTEGFGLKDRDKGLPVGPDTIFAIGSISKQFTSACVILLDQDGKLSVNDPVAKYFPDLTRAADITLLDLMNHVSGYRDYYPLDYVDREMSRAVAVDDVIGEYCRGRLDFEPGTRYSYSNTGYLILGRVVEKVSGLPLAEFMAGRIFGPLGMAHTFFEPDPAGEGFSCGYGSYYLCPPEQVFPEGKGWVNAAGAIYSTPSDLLKWDEGLFGGKVLDAGHLEIMTRPRKLADGTFSNYACGLAVGKRDGVTIYNHTGAVNGFYAFNYYIPSTRTALVLCSNNSVCAETGALFSALAGMVLYGPAKTDGGQAPKAAAPAAVKPVTAPKGVPVIAGPPITDQVMQFFAALQAGKVDRNVMSDDFNYFLTDDLLAKASARLAGLGQPVKAVVESINERGEMEVSSTRLELPSENLRVLMYRSPDGKIQQYFVQKH